MGLFGKENNNGSYYLKLNNSKLQYIQDFISEFFDYTTTISITECEWLDRFMWLEDNITDRETTKEDYHKEALKDLLFDLFFYQEGIKEQILNDLEVWEVNSGEYEYIKDFYNKWKDLFNFEIDFSIYEDDYVDED